jgi:MarR family transcriptional regulator, organic hydroperoxide resistance regulator
MKADTGVALPDRSAKEVGVGELGHLLVEVTKLHRAHAHTTLEKLGLYRGQNFVLTALAKQEGLAQSELAEKLLVSPPTISNSLERMEAAGWIERRTDPEDRRVSRVYLTAAGRALQDSVASLWHDLEVQTFAGLTFEQRDSLWHTLLQIRENLKQGVQPLPCQQVAGKENDSCS